MQGQQNLVWIDLEMTGLDQERDTILEIATIITDSQLDTIYEGPSLVIHHSDEVLATMNLWCRDHHGRSGLTEAVRASRVTLAEAERETYDVISMLCAPKTAILCGNSVFYDRAFLRRLMPRIEQYLHYRIIDVSTVAELVQRWYPDDSSRVQTSPSGALKPESPHRALPDIQASIAQLRYYREHFFKKQERQAEKSAA